MNAEQGLVKRARALSWDGLRALWEEILAGEPPSWPKKGKAFEHLVLRAFGCDGAKVRWPYEVKVGGQVIEEIDGSVHAEGLWCLVECKDTREPAGVEPIAKLRNQLLRRPSPTVGLLFSVGGFTEPARTLAGFVAPQTILLWERDEVDHILKKQSICAPLVQKYRRCVEEGRPDYRFDLEEQA